MKLSFNENTYEECISIAKKNKKIITELNAINLLDKVELQNCGNNNDLDNFQIFTPKFIVDDMIKAIGEDYISNISHTILEPTSGDGAFTCNIFELRLKKNISDDTKDIFTTLLRCLATIYSIEMDKDLIIKQRNNIYTIAKNFLNSKNVLLKQDEDDFLKILIFLNFIWGETNIKTEIKPLFCEVAYKMPNTGKNTDVSIDFPVWNFDNGKVSLHFEEPEIGC